MFRVELIAASFLDLICKQARLNAAFRAFLLCMQHSHSTDILINKQGMCFKLCSHYTYRIALTLAQKKHTG